jgi:hypothetical protein
VGPDLRGRQTRQACGGLRPCALLGLRTEDGARIERHVPALPLSRDRERIDVLRRSLAAYRMVFGQARQEDLLTYLLTQAPGERVERLAQELRIDLEPPRTSQ